MQRVLAFWSWNGDLEEDRLDEIIRGFQTAGIGGFFMHARAGLKVEYLSEEWFDRIRFSAETARKYGLEAWLYDENGWPSGYAGGRVPRRDPAFCQTWMLPVKAEQLRSDDEVLALFEGKNTAFVRRKNSSYADLMNPDAVRAFLDCTYEAYAREVGDLFGSAIPGIFTDEPQLSNHGYPYTEGLFELFEKKYGYSLKENLLLLTAPGANRVKYDYRRLVAERYRASYTGQIGAWCRAHGLLFTGHMAAEDGVFSQVQTQGSVMPCYADFGVPGIDVLGKRMPPVTLLKQVSSAAEQMNKPGVLSETFGASGHAARPSDWLDLWFFQAMHGINTACLHLSPYSATGRRKRDYPPTFSFHLNYYEKFDRVSRPMQKLAEYAAVGQRRTEVLVLNPVGGIFASYRNVRKSLPLKTFADTLTGGGVEEDCSELATAYRVLLENLLAVNVDFHLGDETLMRELRAEAGGGRLRVDGYAYRAVVLPLGISPSRETCALLEEFARGGGLLLYVQKLPERVEGEPSDLFRQWQVEGLLQPLTLGPSLMKKQLRCYGLRPVFELYGEEDFRPLPLGLTVRTCQEGEVVFVRNTLPGDCRARFSWEGKEYQLSLEGGENVVLDLRGEPSVYRPRADRLEALTCRPDEEVLLRKKVEFSYRPLEDNMMVVDDCEGWVEDQLILKGNTFRVNEAVHAAVREAAEVRIVWPFVNRGFSGPLTLVLEGSEELRSVRVNGREISPSGGWYYDPDFKTYDISGTLQEGENRVEALYSIRRTRAELEKGAFETESNIYFYNTEFEPIYLRGPFYVGGRSERRRNAEREFVNLTGEYLCRPEGQPDEANFPFYRGRAVYEGSFESAEEGEAEIRLACTYPLYGLSLNGGPEVFVTDGFARAGTVRKGRNTLTVTCRTGDRNMMGPFHYFDCDNEYTGPGTFAGIRGWEDNFNVKTPFLLIPEQTFTEGKNLIEERMGEMIEIKLVRRT